MNLDSCDAGMWSPFTERARMAIVQAQKLADMIGSNQITTGILLFGLLSDEDSPAYKMLNSNGVDIEELLQALTLYFEMLVSDHSIKDRSFSANSKTIIEMAFSEARSQKHNYIGADHLLLAMMKFGSCSAYIVLNSTIPDIKLLRDTIKSNYALPQDYTTFKQKIRDGQIP